MYSIVKQSGGNIWVGSELGHGTTFRVNLPRQSSVAATSPRLVAVPISVTGSETILLVEDEEVIRELAKRSLEAAGFKVLATAAGDEALQIVAAHAGRIHLLLTDMVMPRMGGRMLAKEVTKAWPSVKVLYMSGYADGAFAQPGAAHEATHFISKPFAGSDLSRKVREVLDSGFGSSSQCRPTIETETMAND